MKSKNILATIKSKSLKEAKSEINQILDKLEKENADLQASKEDYQRLIQLNNHIASIFTNKVKEISSLKKNIKKKFFER